MLPRLLLCASIFYVSSCFACWKAISLEELVPTRSVVVIGELVRIDEATIPAGSEERFYDVGYIKVQEVLRNALPNTKISIGDEIPLSMPSQKNKHRISIDLRYAVGTKGVWLLNHDKKTFEAIRPDDQQPALKRDEILAIIKKIK
jgi:hypothetical protein